MTTVQTIKIEQNRRKRALQQANLTKPVAKDAYNINSCAIVEYGEAHEWLVQFFKSTEKLIDRHYKAICKSKPAMEVLINRAMSKAVMQQGDKSIIDLSKLVFTNGEGITRKLRNVRLRRGLKVRIRWNKFESELMPDEKNILVLYINNPTSKEYSILEMEENRESTEAFIKFHKAWLSHTVHIWGFWYQTKSDRIIASSKSQYLGDFTLVRW